VTQHQNETAASATVDDAGHDKAFRGLLASLSDCFARSETRETFARVTRGMLMELDDVNCWSLSEAIGERGPHRLHHLVSRAVWDEQAVLQRTAAWAVGLLDNGDAILITSLLTSRSSAPGERAGRVREDGE
jgi:SRSO17 transposase